METTQAPIQSTDREPAPDRVRIVSTPGTCGGRPRIDGHRITVEDVAIWHERMGMSPETIVSVYPTITLSDVYAALAYYFENREQIDADIQEGERVIREIEAHLGSGPLQVAKDVVGSATQAIRRLLTPVVNCLTPEVAERLVALRADPVVQDRVDYLAEQANEGLLTESERLEYDAHVRTATFIAILQARARRLLRDGRTS